MKAYRSRIWSFPALCLTLAACDGSGESRGSNDSQGVPGLPGTSETGAGESSSNGGESSSGGTNTGAGTNGEEGTPTNPHKGEPDPDTGVPHESGPSDDEEDDDGGIFDVPTSDGGSIEGEPELISYIWIANSAEGTVSKIDTRTLHEVGRYIVRPDGGGYPSRTSVNLDGDVVVASRMNGGGVTKILARTSECTDQNGDGRVRTSRGKDSVLDWGMDDCVVWHSAQPGGTMQRPVAWTAGRLDPDTGERSDFEVWTAWTKGSQTFFGLLNGDTGAVTWSEEHSEVTQGIDHNGRHIDSGPYGAAVDKNNDFWGTTVRWSNNNEETIMGELFHIGYNTRAFEVIEVPWSAYQYGIAVDEHSRPWICGSGVHRYNPATADFTSVPSIPELGNNGRGCMSDGDGTMWVAAGKAVVGIDLETMAVTGQFMPETGGLWGISHDYDGNIWAVPHGGAKAYRINPDTGEIDFYEGLNGPYTYSDMTGFALASVAGAAD